MRARTQTGTVHARSVRTRVNLRAVALTNRPAALRGARERAVDIPALARIAEPARSAFGRMAEPTRSALGRMAEPARPALARVARPFLLAALACAAACTAEVRDPLASVLTPTPGTPGPKPNVTPSPSPGPTTPAIPPFAPGAPVVRRLVAAQYLGAIEATLGASARAAATPPEDAALNGLDAIGSAQLAPSGSSVRLYESSARAIAEAAQAGGAARRQHGACEPTGPGDGACMQSFVGRVGRLLFRRPLTMAERDAFVSVGLMAAARLGDFDQGATWALAGLLQAPSFLYRAELGEPAPSGGRRLSALELATRLAFFLTDRPPDAALLDAAESGRLLDPTVLRAEATRLLATPEARGALLGFFDERLGLRALATVPKDTTLFPQLTGPLRAAMRDETLRLIGDLAFDAPADFRTFFTADHSFLTAPLATLYGLQATGPGVERVSLAGRAERGGFLGHAAFATLMSHPTTTSPTLRGKFVREVLMCDPIEAPPQGVLTVLPEDPPGGGPRTLREKLDAHVSNPSCAGCHLRMDGIGFGLEALDPIGRFRTQDVGKPLDTRATLDGKAFQTTRELGVLLAAEPRTMRCMVRGLFRQAAGRLEAATEEASLQSIEAAFVASGYRIQPMLLAMVGSEAFLQVSQGGAP